MWVVRIRFATSSSTTTPHAALGVGFGARHARSSGMPDPRGVGQPESFSDRSFASSGNGGSLHLCGELFKGVAGIDMVHAPYKYDYEKDRP
jgi:hypothetical protein